MNVSDTFAPVILVVTAITSAFSIGEGVVDYFTPPPIEGSGIYSDPVRPGETATVVWTLTKRTECPGESARVWDGANGFHLSEPLQPTGLSPGGDEPITARIPTRIPIEAPPGELRLRIVGTYCPDTDPTPFELGPVVFEVTE